jgi:antitoxin component YwqK of YwqJK toxin-antitoxin module
MTRVLVEAVKNISIAMAKIFKKIFFIILIIVACDSSYKPSEVFERNDSVFVLKSGKPLTGYVRTFYENNKLKSVKEYKNGVKHGYYLRFYPNGKMSLKMKYFENKPLYYTQYYENGKIKAQSIDSADYKIVIRYYDNGAVFSKETVKNGLLNGKVYHFHENGKIKAIITYKNGKKNGVLKLFYPDGKLNVICNYVNDSLDGLFKSWSKEGYYGEEYFKKGKRVGVWKYYYPDGKIKAKVIIDDNGIVKQRIEYDSKGNIVDVFTSN